MTTSDFRHLVIRDMTAHFQAKGHSPEDAARMADELVNRVDAIWDELTEGESDGDNTRGG